MEKGVKYQSIMNASISTTWALLTLTKSRHPLFGINKPTRFTAAQPISSSNCLSRVHPPIPKRCRLQCVTSNDTSFASGGGKGGESGGSGGDDGGGSDGGDAKTNVVASDCDDASAVSTDVITLTVGGMSCGGCAASVKRILESQPQVSSASVNLTTEVAVVWPVSEAKLTPNWQQQLGEMLAKHLTSCGFTSNIRCEALWVKWQVGELHKEKYHYRTKSSLFRVNHDSW